MKKENESEVVVAQTCYSTDRKVTIGNEDNLNIEKPSRDERNIPEHYKLKNRRKGNQHQNAE